MRPTDLEIAKINSDGSTQVRAGLSKANVTRLRQCLKDEIQLDPIVVMFDGAVYWPADGLHRIEAHKQEGFATIRACVFPGTRLDAIERGVKDNKGHGLPMSNADKAHAVTLFWTEFPGWSSRQIAEAIGVSPTTALKYKAGEVSKLDTSATVEGKDGKTYPAHKPKSAPEPDSTPEAAPAPESTAMAVATIDSASIPFDTAPEHAKPVLDELGTLVTNPAAIADFARRDELTALMDTISNLKCGVANSIKDGDPLYMVINATSFDAGCVNLRQRLLIARPYAVCCYCRGVGCKECRERGWLGKESYDLAPREMKRKLSA